MSRDVLRSVVALIIAAAAPGLTAIVLFHELPDGAHEAAVVLVTLAWQHVGTIIRNMFAGAKPRSLPRGRCSEESQCDSSDVKPLGIALMRYFW